MTDLKKIGVGIPEVLLPKEDIDMYKWAVVACDQFTSQPEYWDTVETIVDGSPSTLRIMFPEAYLDRDTDTRIRDINHTMKTYKETVLEKKGKGFVYIDRQTSNTPSRKGLLLLVDLEEYDFNRGSETLIRATEGTVLERIPPRVAIRQDACLELPHIMVLIDDPNKTVIEPLANKTNSFKKLYDFNLMMNGGKIQGYQITEDKDIEEIVSSLDALTDKNTYTQKYSLDENASPLLFAVGDGNHSLATAKTCWDNLKPELPKEKWEDHPSRYALVEVVNVHDDGLVFEPIHRIVVNYKTEALLHAIKNYLKELAIEASWTLLSSEEEADSYIKNSDSASHVFKFVSEDRFGIFSVRNPRHNIEAGTLQGALNFLMEKHPSITVDYIHGDNVLKKLTKKQNSTGFFLPTLDKKDLFRTIILDGALPRKTFSMGDAEEKRYYIECRQITK